MSRKWFLFLCLIGLLFLGASIMVWGTSPLPVAAQCGENPPPKSSCVTCHVQENQFHPNEAWHDTHALQDCCTNCHGGNCMASDKELAHQGLVPDPLEDIYTNCYHCHPDDYQEKAQRFALILGVTPGSSPTPTPVPAGPVAGNPIVILPPPTPSAASLQLWIPLLGGFTFLLLTFIVLGIVSYRLRIQKHTPT
jgi:hypothetical protein